MDAIEHSRTISYGISSKINLLQQAMLRNYLKTAFRNLWREKGSTTLNLAGLTLGIASSLVLFLITRHMSSFDVNQSRRDSIYRVVTESDGNQGKNYSAGVPAVLPDAFRNDFPEAEEVTFTSYENGGLITIHQPAGEPRKYEEERGIVYAQPSFFRIFDRKIFKGDPEKALDEPNKAIISKELAAKYFGKDDAMGEVISFDKRDYKVAAILDDDKSNTDFPFRIMLSYVTVKKQKDEQGWRSIWSDEQCYFLLKEGERIEEVERRMPDFTKKYIGEAAQHQSFAIQPFSEIHFDERFGNYSYNTVSKGMITTLVIIAIFLIVTACINFINLSTAEAIKRSKEVGIRKSLGGTRGQLVAQFLGESAIVTAISMILALGITQLALAFLNPFLGIELRLDFMSDPSLWIFVLGISVTVSALSGFYPSMVVSGFNPVLALKNSMGNRQSSGFNLRRALVVLQFSISQFLIIGTIVLVSQMNYFMNKDLGFRKEAILTIPVPEREEPTEGASKMRTLRNEVIRIPGVELASLSNTPPSSGSVSGTDFTIEGNDKMYETQVKTIDENYLELYGLKLAAGNNLDDGDTARGFVVNEKLAAMAGYSNPTEIIGKKIKMWRKTLPVVGVVKDFHTVSLRGPIEATIMLNRIRNYQTLSVRINPLAMQETIKEVQHKWEAAYPDFIFSYRFLDDSIREFYESEQRSSVLLTIFTSMAIFIGCLGLFGLASFMANQKTKEIGVRKVLGASLESIVMIFSREYIKLIAIGFFVAAPLAWFAMKGYLDEFAYKIELTPLIFLAGLGLTLLIAMATVGYRSFKAAIVNPSDSLRSE
jgi:putative ABC transport system permease protein